MTTASSKLASIGPYGRSLEILERYLPKIPFINISNQSWTDSCQFLDVGVTLISKKVCNTVSKDPSKSAMPDLLVTSLDHTPGSI